MRRSETFRDKTQSGLLIDEFLGNIESEIDKRFWNLSKLWRVRKSMNLRNPS